MSMTLTHTEIVWEFLPWPVTAYRILSRRTWQAPLCMDSAHLAAFVGEATTPTHCPSCAERLRDDPNSRDAQRALAAPARTRRQRARRKG